MDELELKQTLQRLEEQQQKIVEQLEKSQVHQRRDFWDKLAAVSPILSGIAIALSALLCTYQYNQQQIKLQEAQTVERFIPHLMGNDTSKRMAILAMKTLVNTDLAAKYAAMFPSEGTLSALKTIAKTGDIQDKKIVSQALDRTINELTESKKADSKEKPADTSSDDNVPDEVGPKDGDQTAAVDAATDVTRGDTVEAAPDKTPDKAPDKKPATKKTDDKESLDTTSQYKHDSEAKQSQPERARTSVYRGEEASDL